MMPTAHDHPAPPGRLSRRDWSLAFVAAALAAAIAMAFAAWRGFYFDEFLTYNDVVKTVPEMVRNRLKNGHSPLYFFFARLGLHFGNEEFHLRLPSIVALFFSILALAWLVVSWGLRRHLVPILAVAVCTPGWFINGTTARYMSLLILCSLAALAAAVHYSQTWSRPRGQILALVIGLVMWIHASAQFIALALLVFILWELCAASAGQGRRLRLGSFRCLWPLPAGMLLSAPLLYLIRNHSTQLKRGWMDLSLLGKNVLEVIFGEYQTWPRYFGFSEWPVLVLESLVVLAALVLARRALLASGHGRVWRLLVSVTLAIPVAMAASTILVRNFQGPSRYLTVISIPVIIMMGVAWFAPLPRRWLLLYRAALVLVLACQFSATVLSRGDRYREAVQFIIGQHTGTEPVMACSAPVGRYALQYHGLHSEGEVHWSQDGLRSMGAIVASYRKRLQAQPSRGFFLQYHGKRDMGTVVRRLESEGCIKASRSWQPTPMVIVGAFICDERDRPWLASLPGPQILWGPDAIMRK